MKFFIVIFATLFFSYTAHAEKLSFICGDLNGYSYYFEDGLIKKDQAGFTEDGLTNRPFTLYVDEKNNGEVFFTGPQGELNNSSSQGADIVVSTAGDNGINWFIFYPDRVVEVYSLNTSSMVVAIYRNDVGNRLMPKNSLFTSKCRAS